MTPPTSGVPHATLLAEMSWLRRLARELVGDADLADELVQEAYVAALQHAPRETPRLRQWLGTVVRNAWRQRLRAGGRREGREVMGAQQEAVEGADHLVERVALQRLMAGAVLELDEPYRSTILLRFFEDLPPREIARRTGVPLATVMSRIQRALARLRERLDREHRSWVQCLVPWIGELAPVSPSLLSLLMKTKIVAAALVVALAGFLYTWKDGPSPEPPSSRASLGEDALAATSAPPTPAPSGDSQGRPTTDLRRPAESPPARPTPAVEEAPLWTVNLRVLDAEARPMPGIPVCAEGSPEVLGTSGSGGWCVFQTRAAQLALGAADERWVTIHEGFAEPAGAFEPVLVVAPALALAGTTVDEDGRLLPGVRVRVALPADFETRFDDVLDATRPRSWVTTSDAQGRFDLGAVPGVEGARLRAYLAGFEHDPEPLPLGAVAQVELVLARPALPATGVLEGRVVDRSLVPVDGARVSLGLASVVTDERGNFRVDLARAVTTESLSAVKPGFQPAVMERPEEPGDGRTGWPDFVELVVGEPALSIRGRVVDPDGEPVAGARLWLDDPTPGAPIGTLPVSLEGLMSGQRIPAGALESAAFAPASDGDGDGFWDMATREPEEPSALWNFATADATGAFELSGLADRRYVLKVLGPDALSAVRTRPIPAGERGVLVRLEPAATFETVDGRVVGPDGRGVPGVSVRLFMRVLDAHARVLGGRSQTSLLRTGEQTTTDEQGRFRFQAVPRAGVEVSLRADEILPHSAVLTDEHPVLEVLRRCHMQVVLGPNAVECDAISVRREDGRPLDLLSVTEGGVTALTHMPLKDGRSAVLAVSEEARRVVLWSNDVEVAEVPVFLVPGEINRVTP
jgi:RNA polymerase sigma-70 factor (ECF subfamily)